MKNELGKQETQERLCTKLVSTISKLAKLLEGAGLIVSGKSAVVASSKELTTRTAEQATKVGVKFNVEELARDLGLGSFNAGKPVRAKTGKMRNAEADMRVPSLSNLARETTVAAIMQSTSQLVKRTYAVVVEGCPLSTTAERRSEASTRLGKQAHAEVET